MAHYHCSGTEIAYAVIVVAADSLTYGLQVVS